MSTNELNVKSTFTTKEIGLVAYLDTFQIKPIETTIVKTNANGKKIAQFVFNKSDQAIDLKNGYFESQAKVEPIYFMDAIRKIKTKINNLD
jgi:hypothetical protein